MKKLKLLTCLLLSASCYVTAQSFTHLDIGGVNARIHSDGHLFQDQVNNAAAYEVPRGSGNNAIFSSAFWMSSQEMRNNLPHYAVGYEKFGLDNFFRTGPVDIVNQVSDTTPKFQRLWKINKSDIDNHIANWNSSSYVAPASILDWPGNGNANTAKLLAPFKDLDNDSIYEPLDGEYPLIKGDQAVYTISNSYLNIYGDSLERAKRDSSGNIIYDGMGNVVTEAYASFAPMKIETHLMVYGFITNNVDVLNTVFVNVKMYNRSNSSVGDHKDFRLSIYNDFDLGNPSDDYVGTDTIYDMIYAYNGDSFDDPFAGTPGYGSNLPAIGVKLLNKELQQSMYFNVGSATNGDPELLEHYVNYQRSVWKNDQHVFYSGNGLNFCVDSNTTVDFMFAGDPTSSASNQWTEVTPCVVGTSSNSNAPGDRRMLGGPKLPKQFNHGTSIEFDYAYVFAQSSVSNTDAVAELRKAADSVQQFFDRNVAVGVQKVNAEKVQFSISPNPANEMVSLSINEKNFELKVFDIRGSEYRSFNNIKTIDVSDFPRGIYFLQVKTSNRIGIKKLVINK